LTGQHENGRTPAEMVMEFCAALRDRRISDLVGLVDTDVDCRPMVRPGLSVYFGYQGMIQLAEDMHAIHGEYDFRADMITEQDGPAMTVGATILPEPGRGLQPLSITSTYTFRNGKIISIESHPGQGTGQLWGIRRSR
jgi:hypothetical protein